MKKYLLPTVTVIALMLGFLIGNAISNKANAQRFIIQNGQIISAPSSKVDNLLQLMEHAYVDPLNIDSITDEAMQELVKRPVSVCSLPSRTIPSASWLLSPVDHLKAWVSWQATNWSKSTTRPLPARR